ncbi:MAG: HypC/HybG/HupF family hydrogenase formation chaperone [Gemmatimonadaceae bacterium]
MCLAIPGMIVELPPSQPHLAVIEVSGVRRRVNVDLLRDDGIALGDWVLIHVGFAMSKIGVAEAEEQIRLLKMLGEDERALEELSGYRFDQTPS